MKRVYSDAERAAAMAAVHAAGGPPVTPKMAREIGIARGTLQHWIAGDTMSLRLPDVEQLGKKAEDSLRAMWRRIAEKAGALAEVTLDAFEGIPDKRMLKEYATTAAIATDKHQVLSGQPNAIIAVDDLRKAAEDAGLDPDEVLAEVNAILKEHA